MEIGKGPWWALPVERRGQGGYIKEYARKNAYNAGIGKLALWGARVIRTPGSLGTLIEQELTLPTAANGPDDVSPGQAV